MKIGIICDDYWHPGTTVKQGLEPLGTEGFQFEFIQHASEWTRIWMDGQDAVVLAKSNQISARDKMPWLTDEIQAHFVDYVEQGKGLLVLHSGTVGYREERTFFELIGGVFNMHPEACQVTMSYTDEAMLPIETAKSFSMHDEHYYVEVIDERIHVFLTSTSEHGTQPAGWVREQGKGRVCVLTPGHFLEALKHPDYQAAIAGALKWCSGYHNKV
ncbi:ThuA domain-containing protein [Paenibacillus alkaliterrae]|uniref:ThuA domain-containing protein n=1 Tax=Paenibacillus alkaliterrae TaxID=320909 RepID=UPI001F340469|nr:ThuA domain-containing protein [Paenibacillus alkaliterrae]MCF2939367.1 ThuA domain-containing protein [Paenibacillus alkaliterrae]